MWQCYEAGAILRSIHGFVALLRGMQFTLEHRDPGSSARAGTLSTDHGDIQTPIFMPVGTAGTVKGVTQQSLESDTLAQIILGNTYHLYLRPGMDVLKGAGGLHKFNGWNKPMLTDSGGYQVYSLSDMRKITEEGAKFRSHIDGSQHLFTPEKVMDIQRTIGADIITRPDGKDSRVLKTSLRHYWPASASHQFNLGLGYTNRFSDAVDVGNQELKIDLGWRPIFQASPYILNVNVSLSYAKWKELEITFPEKRRVHERKISLNLSNPNVSYFGLTPSLNYTFLDRDANIEMFRVRSHDMFIGLTNAF
jgi:hypothetical protein